MHSIEKAQVHAVLDRIDNVFAEDYPERQRLAQRRTDFTIDGAKNVMPWPAHWDVRVDVCALELRKTSVIRIAGGCLTVGAAANFLLHTTSARVCSAVRSAVAQSLPLQSISR